jgi:hypothetical protein
MVPLFFLYCGYRYACIKDTVSLYEITSRMNFGGYDIMGIRPQFLETQG